MEGIRSNTTCWQLILKCRQLKHQLLLLLLLLLKLTDLFPRLPKLCISRQIHCEPLRKEKGMSVQLRYPHVSTSQSAGIDHLVTKQQWWHAHNNSSNTTFPSPNPLLCVCVGEKDWEILSFRPSILWNNPYSYLSWLGILLSLCNSLHPILLLHIQCFWGAGRAAEGRENVCYSQRQERHSNTTIKQKLHENSIKSQGEETFADSFIAQNSWSWALWPGGISFITRWSLLRR